MQASHKSTTTPALQHANIDKVQPVNYGIVLDSTVENNEPSRDGLSCPQKPSDEGTGLDDTGELQNEHTTRFRLFMVMFAVTLVCFIMMLDMSIVVTVRVLFSFPNMTNSMVGYPSNHQRFSFSLRCGMVWQCISPRKVCSSSCELTTTHLTIVAPFNP